MKTNPSSVPAGQKKCTYHAWTQTAEGVHYQWCGEAYPFSKPKSQGGQDESSKLEERVKDQMTYGKSEVMINPKPSQGDWEEDFSDRWGESKLSSGFYLPLEDYQDIKNFIRSTLKQQAIHILDQVKLEKAIVRKGYGYSPNRLNYGVAGDGYNIAVSDLEALVAKLKKELEV